MHLALLYVSRIYPESENSLKEKIYIYSFFLLKEINIWVDSLEKLESKKARTESLLKF